MLTELVKLVHQKGERAVAPIEGLLCGFVVGVQVLLFEQISRLYCLDNDWGNYATFLFVLEMTTD